MFFFLWQVYRDVHNSLKILVDNGLVVIYGVNPQSEEEGKYFPPFELTVEGFINRNSSTTTGISTLSTSVSSGGSTQEAVEKNQKTSRAGREHVLPPQKLGEAWKAVVALRRRPDIDLVVVDIDHGIAVIKKLSPVVNPVTASGDVAAASAAASALQRTAPQYPSKYSSLSSEWESYLGVNPISMLEYELLENHGEELLPLVSLSQFYTWLSG